MPQHEGPAQDSNIVNAPHDANVTESPLLGAFVAACLWVYERRGLAYLAGLTALTVFMVVMEFSAIGGYLTAQRRTTANAKLVQSETNERYNRRTKEWVTTFSYTYRFYVDDKPQEWSETSRQAPAETRRLHLYLDKDGTWRRFELGRGLVATVFLVVVEAISIVAYVRER